MLADHPAGVRAHRRDQRRRPGHRHPRTGPGADLRAVLPRRPGPVPRDRRHRARTRHRQARHSHPWRQRDSLEQGGRRIDLHAAAPAAAHAPVAVPPSQAATRIATVQGGSPVTRVLVVEDEESFSDALSYMLRKEGFEVAVCPDRARRARGLRSQRRRPGAARPHAARAAGQRGMPDAQGEVERAGDHADREGQRDRQGRRA